MVQSQSRDTTLPGVSLRPGATITYHQEWHRMQEVRGVCGKENASSEKVQHSELILISDKILERASSLGVRIGSGGKKKILHQTKFLTFSL